MNNPEGLDRIDNNCLVETDASGAAEEKNPGDSGSGILVQKALEESTVI